MLSSIPKIFRYALAAVALTGAYFCFVFARASYLFQQDTATSVPAAVRLAPTNGAYVARLAGWQPDEKVALLERAVALNPFYSDSWIQLGLTAEMEHRDASAAERYYLQAAKVNHMFLPKWTLTNFYFRQQRPEEFFRWARQALEITPFSADPVFAQMWLMSQDPQRVASFVPDRAGVLLGYASFLANAHQYGALAPVVKRLLIAVGNLNPRSYGRDDQIGPIEDRLLAAGDLGPALDIWRNLQEADWISLPAPTAARPITNGEFRAPFWGHGFDWTPVSSSGVTMEQMTDEQSLQVALSGDEPEHCMLLRQYVPLDPNRTYQLRWKAEGLQLPEASGIHWQIEAMGGDLGVLTGTDLLDRSNAWTFRSPNGANLALLTLEYTRPAGQVRASGSITLRNVTLQEK